MQVIQGCTTLNNKWEILSDKDIAKHDLLMFIYTNRGDCDWDPSLGTTIQDQIFQIKTEVVKNNIIEDIEYAVDCNPYLTLENISADEIQNGWSFNVSIRFLNELPEEWSIPITEETVKEYISTGTFPLI